MPSTRGYTRLRDSVRHVSANTSFVLVASWREQESAPAVEMDWMLFYEPGTCTGAGYSSPVRGPKASSTTSPLASISMMRRSAGIG